MLFGVRRQPRFNCYRTGWPWTSTLTNVISWLGRPVQRLHTSDVIFSGIQPTGVPHLGNYLGALQPWARLQAEALPSTRLLYSIVDLHAITHAQDADRLWRWKRETLATLLAVGLDPERSTIFFQSSVCLHEPFTILVRISRLRFFRFRSIQSWCGYWVVLPPSDTFLAWHNGRFVTTDWRRRIIICLYWLIIDRAS